MVLLALVGREFVLEAKAPTGAARFKGRQAVSPDGREGVHVFMEVDEPRQQSGVGVVEVRLASARLSSVSRIVWALTMSSRVSSSSNMTMANRF